ncbi:MAG: hypothetical protein ACRDYA_21870 [Egibacteraceae bacterium]
MTGDPGRVVERDGHVVVVTPCGCRSEVVLRPAQARRWQACPVCGRLWLLYVLGSGRVLWSAIRAEPQPIRRLFGINRVWGWWR